VLGKSDAGAVAVSWRERRMQGLEDLQQSDHRENSKGDRPMHYPAPDSTFRYGDLPKRKLLATLYLSR
jgi:hypothetical protein